jgi:hypothetical protein
VLAEDIASRAVIDPCAPGAFTHVGDEWRAAWTPGPSAYGWPSAYDWQSAVAQRSQRAQETPSWAPAVIPALRMRGREIVAAPLAKTLLGQTTVRTQPTYNFTRAMATGDGTAGPHRWRLPD